MKERNGFVSNSSSTSFYITNISSESKTLVDFVIENARLIVEFLEEYDWYNSDDFNLENMTAAAKERDIHFNPGERLQCVFGDEQGDVIGSVYDYMLRSGGSSPSFVWEFDQFYR